MSADQTADLIIPGVDLELLELQRKALSRAVSSLYDLGVSDEDQRDMNLLSGLEAMLDEWSDKRYREAVKAVLHDEFDHTQAFEEGWCIMENGEGWLEIQRDDESPLWSTDNQAEIHVVERVNDVASPYHLRALLQISHHNERHADFEQTRGVVYMWRRTWSGRGIFARVRRKTVFRTLTGYALAAAHLGRDQDEVPLDESDAVPDLTYELAGFVCAPVLGLATAAGSRAVRYTCGACERGFEVDWANAENLKEIRVEGKRRRVGRCPHCAALDHEPLPRT